MRSLQIRELVLVLLAAFSVCLAVESADKKTAKSSEPSAFSSALNMLDISCITGPLKAMEVVDLMRSGCLVLGFLAVVFWDRRPQTWAKAELLLNGGSSFFAFFAPAGVLALSTKGATGSFHEYMAQGLAGMLLMFVFVQYYMSNDTATRNVHIIIRIMGSMTGLMVHWYGHKKYAGDALSFSVQHCSLMMLALLLYFIGNVVQLYRASAAGGRSTQMTVSVNGLNEHLLFDGFLFILLGFMDFGFPDFSLSYLENVKADGIIATYMRHCGLLMIMSGLQSVLFCNLGNEEDKKVQLQGRLVNLVVLTALAALYQIKSPFVSNSMFLVNMGICGIAAGNAVCALYIRDRKSKKY